MTAFAPEYDCVVLGGGPAGSTCAGLVAEAGFKTLLVERERMPREHIGESLMPETYWVFERLGVLDKIEAAGYAKKVGVQFVNNTGRESAPFFFRSHDDRVSSETWHVDRAHFDKLLFDHAAEKGADCRDGSRALEVLLDGDKARGVKLQVVNDDGVTETIDVAARVVVDATGQSAILSSRLGLRKINPKLKKAAVWRHFRGASRDEEGGGVKTLVMHTDQSKSWFWYIPQADDVVSVGVVGDSEYLFKGRGTPAEVFAEEVAKCPGLKQRLADALPVDEISVAKEFSYVTDRSAGEGWVLVGDAWGFIDPVYSSGVYFALKSAELAADCVIEGLRTGDVSGAQLGKWLPHFGERTTLVRKLVHAFYSGQFRVGKFLMEYPQHNSELVDLLIGRVFGPDKGAIFEDLEPWLDRALAGEFDNDAATGDDANVPAMA
ncbi:MAG: tryptophan 7-halogenase [Pirellulales bacterium]|nr:tryptophan 7-halogenase [Pirellulales bacterium]